MRKLRKIFKKRIRFMIIFTILFVLISGTLVYFFIPEQYEATATLMISSRGEDLNKANYELDQELVSEYRQLVKSNRVLEKTAERVQNDMKAEKLRMRISVSEVRKTNLITLSAQASSAENAAELANATSDVLIEEVNNLYQLDNIRVVDRAKVPMEPSRMTIERVLLFGFACGFAASLVIVLLMEYFDDTIRSPEQINKIFDKPVLGNIPHGVTRLRKR